LDIHRCKSNKITYVKYIIFTFVIVDFTVMKERILRFLQLENKTSSQFAEEIGVQPSSISHIISGRNNPSLDFVMKMLEKYKSLSPDWLLFGIGEMSRKNSGESGELMHNFIEEPGKSVQNVLFDLPENADKDSKIILDNAVTETVAPTTHGQGSAKPRKLLLLYGDKTFQEYELS